MVLLIARSFRAAASALGRFVGDIGLVEEDLALQVMGLDEVAIDDADHPDPGPGQVVGQHRSQGAATAEGHSALQERPLARLAELREPGLAAIAVEGLLLWSVVHAIQAKPMPMPSV